MGKDDLGLEYFTGQFGDLHKRITEEAKAQTAATNAVDKKLAEHLVASCKDVKEHEEKLHGPAARDHEARKMKEIARGEIAKAVPTSGVARWKHIAAVVVAISTIVGGVTAIILALI